MCMWMPPPEALLHLTPKALRIALAPPLLSGLATLTMSRCHKTHRTRQKEPWFPFGLQLSEALLSKRNQIMSQKVKTPSRRTPQYFPGLRWGLTRPGVSFRAFSKDPQP